MFEDSNSVSQEPDAPAPTAASPGMSMATKIVLGIATLYVAASAYLFYDLYQKSGTLQSQLTVAQQQQQKKMDELSAQVKTNREVLSSQVGITEKELAARSAELRRSQQMAESRIAEKENAVNTEVMGVKTEVSGVKTDVASTKSDLEATKAKLDRAIGDLGLQSGLIAHTRDELEQLKHRGDRNYYEFSLRKGNNPTPVSTVSLQLRKTDAKRNKYTLNVIADDRTIEKKDRTIFEPLQFYTGRDHLLYEVVVNDVQKDRISGYLTTPKSAPQPISVQ